MGADFSFLLQSLAWPMVLLLAWFVGERLQLSHQVPRVASYAAVGLLGGLANLPGLTNEVPGLPFLAHLALALVMFELGYRINLRWFRHNPGVLLLGVAESVLTFVLVWLVCGWFGLDGELRLILAALCVSASPAGIVRVANDLRSAGQVTERVLHVCAINCLLSVLALRLVLGQSDLHGASDWALALLGGVQVLVASLGLGVILGVAMPWLLRNGGTHERGVTVVFALAVLLLSALAYGLRLSPLLAALAFGAVARGRRVQLTNAQRGFGTAGDLLTVFLFVYITALLDWANLANSLWLGLCLIAVRTGSKVLCSVAAARWSGSTERKGLFTGLALTPMSAFAILLLEQSRMQGFGTAEQALASMTAMVMVLEIAGPWITQRALVAARETVVTPR